MKNIIFDIGNVLLEFKPFEYLLSLYDEQTMGDLMTIIFSSDEWVELDLGNMTIDEVKAIFCQRNPQYTKEIHHVLDHWSDMLTLIEENVSLIPKLKEKGYNLYILSNFHDASFQEMYNKHEFFQYFDGKIISAYEHVIKPDEKIYRLLLEKYNLVADECLFIDDMAGNIYTAKELGFHTIYLGYNVNLENELKAIGIL